MFQHMKIYLLDLPACSSQQPGTLTTVPNHLTFEEDGESSLDRDTLHTRMEQHSPAEYPMVFHLSSTDEDEEEEEQEDTCQQLH